LPRRTVGWSIMSALLDAGADIEAVDKYQRTAYHAAIYNNHFDALKLLIDRGANVRQARHCGRVAAENRVVQNR
jgi:ankyrin repeat protein